jgi:NADPH2:quinone reductase
VDRLGDGVSGVEQGQLVAALPISGAYAEFVCLRQRELVPVPSGLDPAEAVSLILNYVTAYQMLHRSAKVRAGRRVLIHGAAGGVGTALLQLGRLAGLEMYGTCSSRGASAVTDLGGIPIDYQHQDFVTEIHPRRAMVWTPSSTASAARISGVPAAPCAAGQSSHMALPVQWLMRRRPALFRQDLTALFESLRQQKLKPLVAARLPLREARHAHELLGKGGVIGKIVLMPQRTA